MTRPFCPLGRHAGRPLGRAAATAGLALLLAASFSPVTARAASSDAEAWAAAVEKSLTYGYQLYNPSDGATAAYADAEQTAELPSKFDQRDPNGDGDRSDSIVTPVKNQGAWGTCWGFGAISAAETTILAKGGTSYAKTGLDLSELQLASTVYLDGGVPESVAGSSQAGEGFHILNGDRNLGLDLGGTSENFATASFSLGFGPILEKDATYRNTGVYADGAAHEDDPVYEVWVYRKSLEGADGYSRTTEYLNQAQIDALSNDEDVDHYEMLYYAANYTDADGNTVYTDWSIASQKGLSADEDDLSWMTSSLLELEEENYLPDTRIVDSDGKWVGVNWNAVANIKNELYDSDGEGGSDYSRGVTFGYLADNGYLSDEYAEYAYEFTRQSNHQVTLVGWDDDYPAENFSVGFDESKKELHTPEGNGAWLVKNSWGSQTDDSVDSQLFPSDFGIEENGEHTGYFWISYYDKTLCDWSTYDFDLDSTPGDGSRVIEQYDYLTMGVYADMESYEKPYYQANVFTADYDTDIDTLTCWTAKPNTTVTFQVYLLDDAAQDPTDAEHGKLAYTGEKTFSYGGYHRLELGEAERLAVREGQRYAVVTLQHCEDDGRYYAVCKFNTRGCTQYGDEEADLSWAEDQSFYVLTRINPGESWCAGYSEDGQVSWSDWTKIAKETHDTLKEKPNLSANSYAFDNLPIKVLGTKASYASVDELAGLESELAAAKTLLAGAHVSTDGSDVAVTERWMTQADSTSLRRPSRLPRRPWRPRARGTRTNLPRARPLPRRSRPWSRASRPRLPRRLPGPTSPRRTRRSPGRTARSLAKS